MTTTARQVEQQPVEQQGQAAFTLFGILSGAWATQVLQVGAELGIADILKDGPKTIAELADATQTNVAALTRLMRALVALQVFAEKEPGVYCMSPASWHLCQGYPGSLRNFILFFKLDWVWNLWCELNYAMKTGQSAMRHVHGVNIWEYLDARPRDLRYMNEGMDEFSRLINPAVLASYDFSAFRSLVDVGGGYGSFLKLLTEQDPSFHGILFDRPTAIAEAEALHANTPFASQCTFVGGDFLDKLPEGADAYLFKFVVNDWDDTYARQMFSACRRAIPPHGKLLVAEYLLTPQPEAVPALMNVLTFLGFEGGHGRTEEEFRTLFAETGFTLTRVIPTMSGMHIVEGVPS